MNPLFRALLHETIHRDRQNMIWNMIGSFFYALASMVLAFLVMRIVGENQGGIFSFAFSTIGQQMFIVAYFGVRPFQVTDIGFDYSFGDYCRQRTITSLSAIVSGTIYLLFSGYSQEKSIVIFLMVLYKVIDGFADVYESEFQRNGRLYLTGKANTFRTILSVASFLAVLVSTKHLIFSCIIAVFAQLLGFLLFDFAVLHQLKSVDYTYKTGHGKVLFQHTSLLFISVFLDFYIFCAAKYAIDARLNDAASGYFNIIFMPTSVINLVAGFVIRPFLTSLSKQWQEQAWTAFSSTLKRIGVVITGLAILAVSMTYLFGYPILRLLEALLGNSYQGKLLGYHNAFTLIVLGGGFYALANLMYYALVIMRKQTLIFTVYGMVSIVAFLLSPLLVSAFQILGAAYIYLLLMLLLALLFGALTFLTYRKEIRAHGR